MAPHAGGTQSRAYPAEGEMAERMSDPYHPYNRLKAAKLAARDARRRLHAAIVEIDALSRNFSTRFHAAPLTERNAIADEIEAAVERYVEAANLLPGAGQ